VPPRRHCYALSRGKKDEFLRELARVRKLQKNTPAVQVNTQINLKTSGDERGEEPNR
jgi:hypothetical protein